MHISVAVLLLANHNNSVDLIQTAFAATTYFFTETSAQQHIANNKFFPSELKENGFNYQ